MDYGEHFFKLNKRDESGSTLKELLEQVERQTGRKPEELKGPEFPELLRHVWSAFLALSNSRNPAFSGVSPITFEQIRAFIEVTGTPLGPKEVSAIKRLDNVFIKVMNQ